MSVQAGDMFYDVLFEEYFLLVKKDQYYDRWWITYSISTGNKDTYPEKALIEQTSVKKVA